jgi:glycerate kinase
VKILLAPDSFKESLSAIAVADALEQGIRRVMPDAHCIKVPMADGGEGTVSALLAATEGKRFRKTVMGPLGDPVIASYGMFGDGKTAVIEMAAACGLHLVPQHLRNPLRTTSYGTGELIKAALDRGAQKIIIGVGGSSTNDCGAGMAQALGVKIMGRDGSFLRPGLAGGDLRKVSDIDRIEPTARLAGVEISIACDVENYLVGRNGASHIYGPQKGASSEQVRTLDRNLRHFAQIIERDLGINVLRLKGAGAGGGMAAGLAAFTNGRLRSGIELVIETADLEQRLDGIDVVITGEGRIDAQTAFGKVAAGVAALAGRKGIPVVALGGSLAPDAHRVFASGIDALESTIVRDMSLSEAMGSARRNIREAGERIAKWLLLAEKLSRRSD